ncbi:hypothetical protein V490_09015, partial [Pseudogymnoascus sp. VKM F-3557]
LQEMDAALPTPLRHLRQQPKPDVDLRAVAVVLRTRELRADCGHEGWAEDGYGEVDIMGFWRCRGMRRRGRPGGEGGFGRRWSLVRRLTATAQSSST